MPQKAASSFNPTTDVSTTPERKYINNASKGRAHLEEERKPLKGINGHKGVLTCRAKSILSRLLQPVRDATKKTSLQEQNRVHFE
jgi:DNA-binding PadR family transcriptional regulator